MVTGKEVFGVRYLYCQFKSSNRLKLSFGCTVTEFLSRDAM